MSAARLILLLATTVWMLFISSNPVSASTNICGDINSNTTWTVAGSPYIATCGVQINNSATVTVQPGVTVKFTTWAALTVRGNLQAIGTATDPIIFTTNAATPTRGSWYGISFEGGSSASRLSYVTVSWGGSGGIGLISINTSPGPVMDHLTLTESSTNGIKHLGGWWTSITDASITNCTSTGIEIIGGGINLTNGTISNNGGNGIWVEVWAAINLSNITITNNTNYAVGGIRNAQIGVTSPVQITGNGGGTKDAIGHHGGMINLAGITWDSEIPIVVLGSPAIESPGTLTINAGATVKFVSGTTLWARGKLTAVGTASQPITFTSNLATPTRGSWGGIYFESGSSASQLSYVTAAWGGNPGSGYNGLIAVNVNPGPAMDHLTVTESLKDGILQSTSWWTTISDASITNCSSSGIAVAGGGINLTNATVSNNGGYGIFVEVWAAANLTNITISNNSNYAIGATGNARITTTPPLQVTGNGSGTKNAIGHYGGWINLNGVVWDSEIQTVLVENVEILSPGSLTINPGATVRFAPGKAMVVRRPLTAIGTPSQPITFTSSLATPTAGSWGSIQFLTGSSASKISHATLSYGGGYGAGDNGMIVLYNSSPTLEYLTISNSQTSAIRLTAEGTSNPLIHHCSFINNAWGAISNGNWITINAKLNYWNSTNGPSGNGPGNGQSISTKVLFDPFFTAAPQQPHLFSTATVVNQTFNPANGVNISIPFETTLSGNWTATFKNTIGTILRTYTGNGQTSTVVWDGRDASGTLMLDGTYNFEIQSTASPSGEIAASVKGAAIVIDSTKQLAISSFTVSSAFFSPNNDAIQETTTIQAGFNFEDVNWTLNFRNGQNTIVRSTSGQGAGFTFVWDGKDAGGIIQPEGAYLVELLVADGSMTGGTTSSTTVDTTFPVSQILYPNGGGVLSNFYQAGSTSVAITANTTDTNHQNWLLESGVGATPATWSNIASGTSQSSGNSIFVWYTDTLANGVYTLRLQTWDKAGNRTTHLATLTVGNFKASMNVQQINAATGQTVQYTSTIPFTLTETLVIKNKAGAVVRTLVDGVSRNAGNYVDAWNGKTASGNHLPAGPYFYVATITDGTNTMTWDLTGHTTNHFCDPAGLSTFDPFNNQPLVVTYATGGPELFTIAFSPYWIPWVGPGLMYEGCNPPNHCLVFDEYREGGNHTYRWSGVDSTGAVRNDMRGFVVWRNQTMEKNVVVVYGTRLSVTGVVTASPPLFNPQRQSQTISLNVSSFQNQTVNVNARFENQASLSTLRTFNLNGVNPGTINITWDGKAENGMWVAPGGYTIWLEITDGIGNIAKEQALVTVRY